MLSLSMFNLRVLSNCLAAIAVLLPHPSQLQTDPPSKAVVVRVDTSERAFLEAYLHWAKQHPAVVEEGTNVIHLPMFYLYSASGVALYYGSDKEANAAFLRGLPADMASGEAKPKPSVLPSLEDSIDFISELGPHKTKLLAAKIPTVFAISHTNSKCCAMQDDALNELKARAASIGIDVVEVRLDAR
jgi:hypothetical protein